MPKRFKIRDMLKILKKDGWVLLRTKGSHQQFAHPEKRGVVTVSFHSTNDDLHPKNGSQYFQTSWFEGERPQMKKETYIEVPVVVLKTKNGYNAFSPSVDGCISTAKTVDTALKRMKDALEFHLEGEALVKGRTKKATTVLKRAFDEYDTDALYASLKVAANF